MPTSTTRDRALAIAAGGVFLGGTMGILFEDVILKGAQIQLKHWMTLAVLAGTILAGHLANDARRCRQWLATLGFVSVFVAGTMLVVYQSVGRQAADTIQTSAQVEAAATRRVQIAESLRTSQAMLDRAQMTLQEKCVVGRATRGTCDGIRATIAVYQAAVRGHNADLAAVGPVKVSAPEAEQLAEIVHTILGADKAKVKAAAVLIVPFLVAVFLEFGVIVSLGFAFRHAPTVRHQSSDTSRISDYPALDGNEADNVLLLFRPDDPSDGSPDDRGRPDNRGPRRPDGPAPTAADDRRQEVLQALLTDLALGRTIGSQREACVRYGVKHSTMSDWLTEWEAAGLIPARRTVGRRKEIAAA